MSDKVSIVMPVFNSEEYLAESINSVLSQTYQYWELWLIDDASTDDSRKIIESYENHDPRIKALYNQVNLGGANSRNKAISLAEGRFIAFLDSDDVWLPEKLARQIDFMKARGVGFCYSKYQNVDVYGRFVSKVAAPKKVNLRSMYKCNFIGCLTDALPGWNDPGGLRSGRFHGPIGGSRA